MGTLRTSVRQQTRDLQFHGKNYINFFSILGPALKILLVI